MLVQQILPLIAGAISRGRVKFVGAEDGEELVQDCVAIAAQQLDAAERKGQPFTPGTIAFYALKNLKSGRRSTGSSTTDVMAAGTQLSGRCAMRSLDEPVMQGDDHEDELDLHSLLASPGDDTAMAAGRRMDWDHALQSMDVRQAGILRASAMGMSVNETAAQYEVSAPRIIQIRQRAGQRIEEAWGSNGLEDQTPEWRRGLRAVHERRACRAAR
ncbi:MAG: hypothetical protein K8T26_11170 [Lentisphaerae bacterium]|nr:hypothetical protein [Lentisphaerota bacterium]